MNLTKQPQKDALRIAVLVMLLMVPVWLLVTWSQANNAHQKQRHQIRQILQLHVDSLDRAVRCLKVELNGLQGV